MKKEKGFTLVELLSVIVILSLISILVGVSVTKMVKESKSDLHNAQIKAIKSAAEVWSGDNINRLPDNGKCIYFTLDYLYKNGLLDDDVIDPNTKDEFSDDMIIKISSNASTLNYEIDVDSESVENCLLMLDWIHVDTDNDGVLDAGEIVSRGAEKFYIIKTPEDNDETVSLLASKCIETNPDRQTTTYFRVEFDSVTNEYENSRIKKLVKSYVTRTVGLPETQGRLITYDEAISFEAEHAEEFYGTSTKWYFWFVTPYDSNYVWVAGSDDQIKYAYYGNNYLYGIRPVIDLPLYMIK